jgi:hypothetical protein
MTITIKELPELRIIRLQGPATALTERIAAAIQKELTKKARKNDKDRR